MSVISPVPILPPASPPFSASSESSSESSSGVIESPPIRAAAVVADVAATVDALVAASAMAERASSSLSVVSVESVVSVDEVSSNRPLEYAPTAPQRTAAAAADPSPYARPPEAASEPLWNARVVQLQRNLQDVNPTPQLALLHFTDCLQWLEGAQNSQAVHYIQLQNLLRTHLHAPEQNAVIQTIDDLCSRYIAQHYRYEQAQVELHKVRVEQMRLGREINRELHAVGFRLPQ